MNQDQRDGVDIVTIKIQIAKKEKYIAIIKSMELLPKRIVERRVKFVKIRWQFIDYLNMYDESA